MNTSFKEWLVEDAMPAEQCGANTLVIHASTVEEKLSHLVDSHAKAEILFEIVQPQTSKTLREITQQELKDLCLNFKDGL